MDYFTKSAQIQLLFVMMNTSNKNSFQSWN